MNTQIVFKAIKAKLIFMLIYWIPVMGLNFADAKKFITYTSFYEAGFWLFILAGALTLLTPFVILMIPFVFGFVGINSINEDVAKRESLFFYFKYHAVSISLAALVIGTDLMGPKVQAIVYGSLGGTHNISIYNFIFLTVAISQAITGYKYTTEYRELTGK